MNPPNTQQLPKISIVTPSFNQGGFLERTIRSVLEQGYPNLEYFVIDGGSTDDTMQVIQKYADRITFWVSEPDGGQTEAINKGFRRATGDIVGWLNSDDLYLPGTLKKIGEAFSQRSEEVIYGDYRLITSEGLPFLTRREIPFSHDLMLFGVNFIGQPSSFFRRSVLENHGFLDENLRYAMDYEYWLRLSSNGCRFWHLKQCLSEYRYHPASKTVGSSDPFKLEMAKVRKKYFTRPMSSMQVVLRGIEARLRRQLVKLFYRGKIDLIGGSLHRVLHRFAERKVNRK